MAWVKAAVECDPYRRKGHEHVRPLEKFGSDRENPTDASAGFKDTNLCMYETSQKLGPHVKSSVLLNSTGSITIRNFVADCTGLRNFLAHRENILVGGYSQTFLNTRDLLMSSRPLLQRLDVH